MELPLAVTRYVRGAFSHANNTVTKILSTNPNMWETALDMAVIGELQKRSGLVELERDCFVSIQTHYLGGRPMIDRWEVADIGVVVMFRIRGKLVRTKIALLQSKRLYPREVSEVQEGEQHHYVAGFSRLYPEEKDYAADLTPRQFSWQWESVYRMILSADRQQREIARYQTQTGIPVHYLLYHPYKMNYSVSVPAVPRPARQRNQLGARILTADEIFRACSALPINHAPTAKIVLDSRGFTRPAYDGLGHRLEDFISDRLLGCHEGYVAAQPDATPLRQVFFERTAPIAAAIGITVDIPGG